MELVNAGKRAPNMCILTGVCWSRYAVGVLDKQTGLLRYAEVGSGSIVRMEPRARGVNYGPTGTVTEQDGDIQARILQNKRCAC